MLWLARDIWLLNRLLLKWQADNSTLCAVHVWPDWNLQGLMRKRGRRFSVNNSIKSLLMVLPLWFSNKCKAIFHTKFWLWWQEGNTTHLQRIFMVSVMELQHLLGWGSTLLFLNFKDCRVKWVWITEHSSEA